ncbi:MAG: prepilin peptidase [Candidatus Krumholzibacteria bacterium]|nr:prepilin peptidase [Candidatus Krumholzibacteria bacterium]
MSKDPSVLAAAFGVGLLLGSFLNVVIHRLPRGSSVVGGRSKCPSCGKTIRWYDNVPIVSYVMLRGRCRRCSTSIPLRYPVVELVSGAAALLAVYRFGLSLKSAWVYVFLCVLLVITFIDWRHRIIPDVLSIGGMVFGWVGSIICLDINLIESFVGSVVGGGLLFTIAALYKLVRKTDGMGGGDIKLMAMIGAFLGWKMIFPVLFFASLFGSAYGLILMAKGGHGKTAVAFGSFLAPSATLVYLLGSRLWNLYLGF